MRSANLVLVSLLAACGGSSSSVMDLFAPDLSGDMAKPFDFASKLDLTNPPTGANVVPMVVDGFDESEDVGYVSVKLCVPGTSTCTTLDHVSVDTGSVGARFIASALPTDFLTALNGANPSTTGECYTYGSGFVWGSVHKTDFTIGGETAPGMQFELIGDPTLATIPDSCSSTGQNITTADAFGSNGIIGVGLFPLDCGTECALAKNVGETNPTYWDCTDPTACAAEVMADADQVPNPVVRFPTDNNGVLIELSATPDEGLVDPTGYLVLGVGTQENNQLNGAEIFHVGPELTGGYFNVSYEGQTLYGIFDSGTSLYLFNDTIVPRCASGDFEGFACPTAPTGISMDVTDTAFGTHTLHLRIANASTLGAFTSTKTAFDDLAYTDLAGANILIAGLPYFFGKRMFTAIRGADTPAGPGPFYATDNSN